MRIKSIIVILLCLTFLNQFGQDTTKLQGFKAIVLSEYNAYFENAEFNNDDKLQLIAKDKYVRSSYETKQEIIHQIFHGWSDSLIIVRYGSIREVWGLMSVTDRIILLDKWDYSTIKINTAPEPIINTPMRPFFFYVGGLFSFNNKKYLNIGMNLRAGTYLFKNRFDMALGLGWGTAGSTEGSGNVYFNLGLMSRVHFPIKRTGFVPNIGAEISLSKYGDTEAAKAFYAVGGFSWFVGIGSLDIGVKIGENSIGMGGFTIYPGRK